MDELFGKKDETNRASLAAHGLSATAVRLIYQLGDEERKAYDYRHRERWSTNILCIEYKIVELYATKFNVLPIQTPNLPASRQGAADQGAANWLHGNYPPDNEGAKSYLFFDENGEATCKTYDLLVSACESAGCNLSEFVDVCYGLGCGSWPSPPRQPAAAEEAKEEWQRLSALVLPRKPPRQAPCAVQPAEAASPASHQVSLQ